MSSLNYCRLCVNIGLDFKSLYDENGHANEVYELTTKYFDRSILKIDEAKHLTIICLQCWEHLWDFNKFQQAVYEAQSNLDTVNKLEIVAPTQEAISTSSTDRKGECVYLLESQKSEAPIDIKIEANDIKPLEENDGDIAKVDLALDEDAAISNVKTDVLSDDEYDDPVGVFIGGEFTNENEIIPQPEVDVIDIDSDSIFNLNEYGEINSPNPLPASESENNNLNHKYNNKCYNISANITQTEAQSPLFSNPVQEAFKEEFNKYFEKSVQSLKCAICPEICYGISNLSEHFNRLHCPENIQIVCCNLKLIGLQAMSEHLITHYSPLTSTCELCGKKYARLYFLKLHIMKHHSGEGEQLARIYSNLLNKDYEKKLQKRSRTRYRCSQCGKNSNTLLSLRRHIWTYHEANHKHKCPHCERTFKEGLDLREHITVHTGEDLYACAHCGQKFKRRARFYEHQKKEHGSEIS